ncbi:MAG: hypothetical protein OCD01_11710 [Fibrobacterales bacterium]
MANKSVSLNDIYTNETCDGSVFKAVVMMSQEARYINEQSKVGNIELTMKPTTIAMHKFNENKLIVDEIAPEEVVEEVQFFSPEEEMPAETDTDIFAETVSELDNSGTQSDEPATDL